MSIVNVASDATIKYSKHCYGGLEFYTAQPCVKSGYIMWSVKFKTKGLVKVFKFKVTGGIK